MAIIAALALTAVLFVPALFSDETCLNLWNEPDNAAVRNHVAAAGFESAGITSYSVEGPARVCYVTMFDGAGEARATYVIWPDNLFDNGSLHDYAGPLTLKIGYDGQPIESIPDFRVSSNGRLRS